MKSLIWIVQMMMVIDNGILVGVGLLVGTGTHTVHPSLHSTNVRKHDQNHLQTILYSSIVVFTQTESRFTLLKEV